MRLWLLLGTLFLVGCGGSDSSDSTPLDENTTTPTTTAPTQTLEPLTYYKPSLDTLWQYQLTNEINTSTNATLYDIDLEENSAETIAKLHDDNLSVICYFSAGSAEEWREDFNQFLEEDMGKELDGWDGEYWLDITSQNVRNIMLQRLDSAQEKGCDGVEADNVDGYDNDTGFSFLADEQLEYNRFLAQEAHKRGLSIGLKNDLSQVNDLVDDFDFAVNEQCFAQNECEKLSPFIEKEKPVFNVEYTDSYLQNDAMAQLCNKAKDLHFSTNILPVELDGSWRYDCQDYLFESYGVGVGGANAFKFHDNIYINVYDIINDEYSDYDRGATDFNESAFGELSTHLQHTKFVTFWVTKEWQENWFNLDSIQKLIDQGKTPVFLYWYFGDNLQFDNYLEDNKDVYLEDVTRLGNFIAQLKGDKLLILEPEFNKNNILDDENATQLFVSIMDDAIDTFKSLDTRAYISLSMMDTGSRTTQSDLGKCGYSSCALGDKYEWSRVESIYKPLLEKLDFLSFNEMVAQFSRDPQDPGDWDNPNPIAYSDDDIGIDYLAQRIDNFGAFLEETYHKPVLLPYMAIATATWSDANDDGVVDNDEINTTGWESKAQQVYSDINATHIFGYSVMELFDNPAHDDGGYQFFMQNEYHLGIVKAPSIDKQLSGAIEMKSDIVSTIFK